MSALTKPEDAQEAAGGVGRRPELKWLPIDQLSVDHRYQRTLESRRSQNLIVAIANRFRWSAFQAILATRSGSGWLVIDGQHRVEAARQRGLKEVPAVVVAAASLAEQAAAFVQSNTFRVAVNPLALHRARVAGGDEKAVAVEALCRAAGIEIPPYPIPAESLKPGQTLALGTVSKLAERYGDHTALLALQTLAKACAARRGAIRAPLIQAVAEILKELPLKPAKAALATRIGDYLTAGDLDKLALKAIERRQRYGGTEAASLIHLVKDGLRMASAGAVPASSAVRAPTRAELMGRR
jgi:hypothetical protein